MARGVLPGQEQNAALLHARSAVGFSSADACDRAGDGGACRFGRNLMGECTTRGWIHPTVLAPRRGPESELSLAPTGMTERITTTTTCAENRTLGCAPRGPCT